jgi:triosephosphate isomerase
MRRPLIAGNWKMNLDRAGAAALAKGIAARSAEFPPGVDVLVCPPNVYLETVAREIAGSPVALGAQNLYHESAGAFTGETSAAMLLDVGCRYVILGHSERRHIMGETDEQIQRKTVAALAAGLTPIVCVGETLAERESGRTGEVIRRQFDGSLASLSAQQMGALAIAYEPVWAIGTGKTASPDEAEAVHLDLRNLLASRYNAELAAAVPIQYGGSVKPDNAKELMAQPNIDGALVGGASLKIDDFVAIVAAGA